MVQESITANIFTLPSVEATTAYQTALHLYQWLSDNTIASHSFDNFLTSFFHTWTSVPPINHCVREQIWQRFILFTSSSEYFQFWSILYNSAKITSHSPILSFYLTYTYFIQYWKHKYPLSAQPNEQQNCQMSEDEQCALWYVAGYVIRKVKGLLVQIKKVNLVDPVKQFLEDSIEVENIETELDTTSLTTGIAKAEKGKEWFTLINRGGLTKCNNDFYEHLKTVEMEIKSYILLPSTISVPLQQKSSILSKKESIRISWDSLISSRQQDDLGDLSADSKELIHRLILEEYLKIRCFGHTTKVMELYMDTKVLNLQKSRSFRALKKIEPLNLSK